MVMGHHNLLVLDLLRGKFSIAALDLLVGEIGRMHELLTSNSSCGCHVFTRCGLPCAYQTAEQLFSNSLRREQYGYGSAWILNGDAACRNPDC
ncbi:hypothetical protein L1987_18544 [Smallanthus sonchifolius]|uniref:Uncharacterized protein n=1 Tax=Smallanthus sonchifolius TaxID=185202 RepID=A0ACB9J0J0_9ASTR|nr:hypothetical protein L1987_18544 [Smallanthus sonchifolius]